MSDLQVIAVGTVVLALAYTFTSGFQGAGSVASTFIASRSATPRRGIGLVSVMIFLGSALGGSAVAETFSGLVTIDEPLHLLTVLVVALVTAIIWNNLTRFYGIPSSSTHALIGGLVGAAIAAGGLSGVDWGTDALAGPSAHLGGFVKVLTFLVLSVAIGFFGGFLMERATRRLLRRARLEINRPIVGTNWATASAMAFFYGANDSQKQMGIIALALLAIGEVTQFDIPLWARLACAVMISLGTVIGGWRIMRTLGNRIFKLAPVHSMESQVASGASVGLSTVLGSPVSTTQVVSSSIIGVGASANRRKVKWSTGFEVVVSMILTVPATMALSGVIYHLSSALFGGVA